MLSLRRLQKSAIVVYRRCSEVKVLMPFIHYVSWAKCQFLLCFSRDFFVELSPQCISNRVVQKRFRMKSEIGVTSSACFSFGQMQIFVVFSFGCFLCCTSPSGMSNRIAQKMFSRKLDRCHYFVLLSLAKFQSVLRFPFKISLLSFAFSD